ncbi:MAG: hypothetical protein ACK5JT_08275 [Hyphomicrobiaceae bacterium]
MSDQITNSSSEEIESAPPSTPASRRGALVFAGGFVLIIALLFLTEILRAH